ncbi:MAG: hypothetical protein IMZ61_15340 [Planctomycetes bacterium]|nr:hypothetical protein [Planctomycetota bacterium]
MRKTLVRYCCITVLLGLAGIVLAVSPSEKQQLDNFKVSTLKGLRGVAVKVMIVRDGPGTLAFLKEIALQKEVEFALQNAGLEIASPTPEVGLYVVLVKVTAASADNLNFAMHVQSSLLQIVNLSRDTAIKTESQTWPSFGQGRFGVISVAIAKSTIEKTVKEQAKDFADDWKTANPKP